MADMTNTYRKREMLDLWDASPVEVQEQVLAMLSDERNAHEVEPYVNSVTERISLLHQIADMTRSFSIFSDQGQHKVPNSALQAMVMKADLVQLRATTGILKNAWDNYQIRKREISFLSDLSNQIPSTLFRDVIFAIDFCRAKPATVPVPMPVVPAPAQDQLLGSESGFDIDGDSGVANASRLAKIRDGNVCPFTGTPNPEAAHIFPKASIKKGVRYRGHAVATLQLFWSKQKVMEWFSDVETILETPQNRISLSHQLHFEWDVKKTFALKPISRNHDSIVVQWHWLKPSGLKRKDPFSEHTIDEARIREAAWGDGLARRPSGLKIETGQTFTITTNDPDNLPVPSYALLELNWIMACIAAMAGAGEKSDEVLEDYFDDDGVYESVSGYSEEDKIESSDIKDRGVIG